MVPQEDALMCGLEATRGVASAETERKEQWRLSSVVCRRSTCASAIALSRAPRRVATPQIEKVRSRPTSARIPLGNRTRGPSTPPLGNLTFSKSARMSRQRPKASLVRSETDHAIGKTRSAVDTFAPQAGGSCLKRPVLRQDHALRAFDRSAPGRSLIQPRGRRMARSELER